MKRFQFIAGLYSFYSLLFSCNASTDVQQYGSAYTAPDTIHTIQDRFKPPTGYILMPAREGSYSDYLQRFPLKPAGSAVHLYDGRLKANQRIHAGVLDIDAGNRDLQQCADAVMRLLAEYLFQAKQYDAIHFNFVNGFSAPYSKWARGERIRFRGNNCYWEPGAATDFSYKNFRKYLDIVFAYASTISLGKQLHQKPVTEMTAGDVFIEAGSPGHAVLVVAVATHPRTGKKLFLLAQSYMPAQEIHVLINRGNTDYSPWYEIPGQGTGLHTPEWYFAMADNIYTF